MVQALKSHHRRLTRRSSGRAGTAFLLGRRQRGAPLNLIVIPLGQAVDAPTLCIYTTPMEFTWSEARAANVKAHGLDFVDAPLVFEGVTLTFEDGRFSYGEQRFVTLGLLAGIPVSVVHTESENEIRIISFRQATKREAQIYFSEVQN